MIDLTGKKIMVTGASSGIGRAIAILAAKLGAKVVACGRDEARLNETLAQCEGAGHFVLAFDVRETNRYSEIFSRAVADGQKLNGLVYSAGIAPPTPLRVLAENTLKEIFDVNIISFMLMVAMYSKNKFNDGGSIVAISSINAHYPQKCMSGYIASKCALEGSAMTMALELAEKNILINCVAEGGVETPMTKMVLDDSINYTQTKSLLGLSKPEDIANMVAFLLSDLARQITGRTMLVDGGWLGQ